MDKKNLPLIMGVVVFALVIRNIQLMRQVSKLKEEVAQLKIQPKQMKEREWLNKNKDRNMKVLMGILAICVIALVIDSKKNK